MSLSFFSVFANWVQLHIVDFGASADHFVTDTVHDNFAFVTDANAQKVYTTVVETAVVVYSKQNNTVLIINK